jgi:hypothetical protein
MHLNAAALELGRHHVIDITQLCEQAEALLRDAKPPCRTVRPANRACLGVGYA